MAVQGNYIDGFVLAIPETSKDEYRGQAEAFARVMKKYGMLDYVECWQDDVPEGKVNSFHTAVMRKEGEIVVFSFCTWPDKDTRDKGWDAGMADPELSGMDPSQNSWDGMRMIWGGFTPFINI
ncbi:MAG: DUF1428 domain-containing protein [Pseudomonadota bacterium]